MNCDAASLIAASKCMDCIPAGMQSAISTYLICEWSNATGQPCTHPIVLDWLQRMADDFVEPPSSTTIRAVCDFCEALDTYGLTDKMLVVNPVIPDSLMAMRYPLIWQPTNGFSPFINHNFVVTDLDENGLIGNGYDALAYMDTGFVPSVQPELGDGAGGLAIYESEATLQLPDTGATPEIEIGCVESLDTLRMDLATFDPSNVVGQIYAGCWGGVVGGVVINRVNDVPGFYISSRTATNALHLYEAIGTGGFNSTPISSNTNNGAGAALPDLKVYFMAINTGMRASSYSFKRISFMAIHSGLTVTECEDLFDAVHVLRIALGGGYVP